MATAFQFSECALLPKWEKYTYDQLDCQAFVEAVLKDIGVRKKDGSVYDWRGSNSMYRNYYSWRGTKDECIKEFGKIPVGAFVYIWEPTGQEERGYTDKLGNCTHVGIYCGNNVVRDSTRTSNGKRNGPGTTTMDRFTRVTLFTGLDYNTNASYNDDIDKCLATIDRIRNELINLEGLLYDIGRG